VSGGQPQEALTPPGGKVVTLGDEFPRLHLDDLDVLPDLGEERRRLVDAAESPACGISSVP
jgi:hypothetical protein